MAEDPIAAAAERALAALPERFFSALSGVVILVEDEADAELCARMGVEDPLELLGVFEGLPIGEERAGRVPDCIRLFRRAIEAEAARAGIPLEQCVRETIYHEIGHYFGLNDEELAQLGL
ncbi:MAG: neutral zinc metallopeptidase [Zetaproteobacteria bacterium]|nr:MAG: neutral zinc metallopeptidase [Zetaproteobacteria bacterium]